MEHIENALFNLDKTTAEFNEKQLGNVAKIIYESSEGSIESSNNFDGNFSKYFPEIEQLGETTPEFNPEFVIELKDGTPLKEFTGWDTDYGILSNRRVMGTYYIDIGHENKEDKYYCKKHKKYIDSINCSVCGKTFTYYHNNNCCNGNSRAQQSYTYSCGCSFTRDYFNKSFENIMYTSKIKSASQKRGEDRPWMSTEQTIDFEVDNYLNLYHKTTGLYLMFNKTAFPRFPFYDHDFVFKSKRLENMDFKFDKEYYLSKDKRDELLEKINELVPTDYHIIYDYFNRFRMFPQYKAAMAISEHTSIVSEHDDPRDRIIEELKAKLTSVMEKVNKTNEIIDTMTETYTLQSVEIKELHRELSSKEEEITHIKQLHKNEQIEAIENLKVELFNMNKIVLDKTTIELNSKALGKDIENFKKELKETNNKLIKTRDINVGLIEQIKQLKESNKQLIEQNTFTTNEYNELKCDYEKQNNDIKKYIINIDTLSEEQNNLINQLNTISSNTTDALSSALNDQLEIIKKEKDEITEQYNNLVIENNNIKKKLETITKSLNGLVSGVIPSWSVAY